jgi:hypothetical protein
MQELKLSLKPESGTFNYFIVRIDAKLVMHGVAKEMSCTHTVPDPDEEDIIVEVIAYGIGTGPKYKLDIDLPGTEFDHSSSYTLRGGKSEIKLVI